MLVSQNRLFSFWQVLNKLNTLWMRSEKKTVSKLYVDMDDTVEDAPGQGTLAIFTSVRDLDNLLAKYQRKLPIGDLLARSSGRNLTVGSDHF